MLQVLSHLVIDLQSNNLETQIQALETIGSSITPIIEAAVSALQTTSAKFPIAEKLLTFGASIVRPLENLLEQSTDQETRVYAAMILLKLGSKAGVPILITALNTGANPVGMIANSLSLGGIAEAAEGLENLLMSWDFKGDPYTAATLIVSLKRLTSTFSPQLMERLSSPDIPLPAQLAIGH